MKPKTCKGCGARLSGRQRKWHSEACRDRNRERTRGSASRLANTAPDQRKRGGPAVGRPIGTREPLYRLVPPFDATLGHEAIDLLHRAGLELYDWQQDSLLDAMAVTKDGAWVAGTVLILCSRQNGKTEMAVGRAAWGAAERRERVIWSAHQFRATRQAFRMMVRLVDTEAFRAYEPKVTRSSGQESVEFASGGRIDFVARSGWSGRGFSADIIVLDEAFALDDDQMAALGPSLAASKAGQVWYLSSAPHERSTVLRRLALAGREGALEDTVFREHAAPDGLAVSDVEAWKAGNPSLGPGVSLQKLTEELERLTEEDFAREHLGRWAPEALGQVFDKQTWMSLAIEDPPPPGGDVAFGIDVPPARDSSSIVMAQRLGDDSSLVEVVASGRGATWMVDEVATLAASRRSPVVVDGAGWARELVEPLRSKGVDVRVTDLTAMCAACAEFYDAVTEGRLRHRNDPILNAAVEQAEKRRVGDARWAWARGTAKTSIAPLVAATLAHHGATTARLEPVIYVALPR